MKNIFYASLALLLTGSISSLAQDPHFSQSYANPLKLNPAIMGAGEDFKLILTHRGQYGNIDKGYKTQAVSAIYPWMMKKENEKLDLGINFISDKAGAFTSTDISLSVGYNIRVGKNSYVSAALQGGLIQRSIDEASLTFGEQYVLGSYNSSNPNGETTMGDKISVMDAGLGLMWYYNPARNEQSNVNAFSGLSVFHLNSPNESFTGSAEGKLPMKVCYQGGVKFLGENKFDFSPNVRVSKQGGSEEIAPGIYIDYRITDGRVILGAWYRMHDAVAFSLGMEHKNFTVGYSYDAVSDLKNHVSAPNAHEITLSLKIANSKTKATAKFNKTDNEESNLAPDSNIFSPF